jgi:drug/metabolite transporter superfamily protein YnfA
MTAGTLQNSPPVGRTNQARLWVVVAIALWAIGLRELLGQTSRDPIILDRFSPPFFVFLIVYALAIVPLVYLVAVPKTVAINLPRAIGFVQQRWWLALPILIGSLWVFTPAAFNWERFYKFSSMHIVAAASVVAVDGLILFYGWRDRPKPLWRQIAVGVLVLALVVEGALQVLSVFRALPASFETQAGVYMPYARMYNSTVGNSVTNRYGWHAPAVTIDTDKRKILLVGDEFILSAETKPAEQLAALLNAQLDNTEAIAIGNTGYGPASYFEAVKTGINLFEPDELLLFINLGDDFFNVMDNLDPRTPFETVFYNFSEDGTWNLDPRSALAEHVLFHNINDSHLPVFENSLRSLRTHVLTPKVFNQLFNSAEPTEERLPANNDLPPFGRRQFIFNTDSSENAQAAEELTRQLLEFTLLTAKTKGVDVKLVTIPAFPEVFYTQSGSDWTTQFGTYDLLRPEQVLADMAAKTNTPILTMGEWMAQSGTDVATIQGLYRDGGYGYFTTAGQQYFADAIVDTFYK